MKKIKIILLLFSISSGLSAQVEKGLFMVETGINLTDNYQYYTPSFVTTTGFSFHSFDDYTEQKKLEYSIAPRVGYAAAKNIVVGVDFQYHSDWRKRSSSDHSIYKYHSFLYGTFGRIYFGKGKLMPLVEAGIGLGSSKSVSDETSPGGSEYEDTEKLNLFYLSGGAGASYLLSSRFRVNLQMAFQYTNRELTDTLYDKDYSSIFDTAMVLSFSYLITKK